jgi:hypothetical protein
MAGLLLLFALVAWIFLCTKLSMVVAGSIRPGFAKTLATCAVFAGLLVAPIADEILGTTQYNQYCKAADDVKIVGTLRVDASSGLYEANGDWRIAKLEPSAHDERSRLTSVADSLVRWDHGTARPAASMFPIDERTTRIHDAASARLLAEWKSYHFRGGFLRRNLFVSASQCFPRESGSALYQKLLVLRRS